MRAACPVTKGTPVRMTEHGFASACRIAMRQAREAVKTKSGFTLAAARLCRCLQCRGEERPPELQVVDLKILDAERNSAQPKKEPEMSGKRQDGTCENCGRKNMTLTRLHGDLVCASCGNLFGAMANRPEAVEKALRKLLPQLLPAAGSGDEEKQELAQQRDELTAEVQLLGNQLVVAQELLKKQGAEAESNWSLLREIVESLDLSFDAADGAVQVLVMVRQAVSALQTDSASHRQQAKQLTDENTVLANRISELENRFEGVEPWKEAQFAEGLLVTGYEQDLVRDQLADFALKVLQGRVGVVHREA
jgi:cell division protein FtsB